MLSFCRPMADERDDGPKSNSGPEEDLTQSVIAPSTILSMPVMNAESTVVASGNNVEGDEDEEYGFEEEEEEEEEEGEEDEDEEEEEEDEEKPEEDKEEEMVNDKEKSTIAVNNKGLDTEHNKGKAVGEKTNKEIDAKEGRRKANDPKAGDKIGEKKVEDPKAGDILGEKKVEDPKAGDILGEKKVEDPKTGDESKSKGKRPRPRNRNQKRDPQKEPDTLTANGVKPESSTRKKAAPKASAVLAANRDKPEPSSKKKGSKRVDSMGMVFMCTSKTKADCFRYKVLGLPGNKKDQVAKIYKGMRLFLFDVDLRLLYGIFKAAGPGGYNLEPKAFKADFPSQVRFTVLDDCLPLAEENFKGVLKENYYSRNKFEGLLKAEQVKKLCKLFVEFGRGGPHSKAAIKSRRTRPVEIPRIRPIESRRSRADDSHPSRPREKRKRPTREEDRRPPSPPRREKRRHTDYERVRSPVLYERRSPPPRYLPPPRLPPPAIASPVRLYTYERPLDIPPYVHDHVPEHHTYRVRDVEPRDRDRVPEHHTYRARDIEPRDRARIPEHHTYRVLDVEPRDRDRSRERDPYHVYNREAPPYRDIGYALPPEYHLLSREYHPPAVPAPEYHLSGGSRVPSYRDIAPAIDYRPSAASLPEYRSQTHYRY
uniref:uncharacterized protein LOC122581719 isoform X1 n=2 Tax=Erigeron canadensis TaxID=72917 RepID=UPI001CB8E47C|nr:uncharacterized protein LOC122581719 isoform X1 [Erigeron canadensis]